MYRQYYYSRSFYCGRSNTGGAVGGGVGGAVVFIIILIIAFVIWKKKQAAKAQMMQVQVNPTPQPGMVTG